MFKFNKLFLGERPAFSLIEVVVAISILTVTFIGLMQTFPYGTAINTSARQKTVASYLAQERIEELYSRGYDNIATGTVESKQRLSSDPSSYLYNYQRETEVQNLDENFNSTSSDSGLKRIRSRIFYTQGLTGEEETTEVNTLISKH